MLLATCYLLPSTCAAASSSSSTTATTTTTTTTTTPTPTPTPTTTTTTATAAAAPPTPTAKATGCCCGCYYDDDICYDHHHHHHHHIPALLTTSAAHRTANFKHNIQCCTLGNFQLFSCACGETGSRPAWLQPIAPFAEVSHERGLQELQSVRGSPEPKASADCKRNQVLWEALDPDRFCCACELERMHHHL